jgi:hypothetical protein
MDDDSLELILAILFIIILILLDGATVNDQILIKLLTELPLLSIYIVCTKWLVERLLEGWKYYIDKIASREEIIMSSARDIIVRISLVEERTKNLEVEYNADRQETDRKLNWCQAKIEDQLRFLKINRKKDDEL